MHVTVSVLNKMIPYLFVIVGVVVFIKLQECRDFGHLNTENNQQLNDDITEQTKHAIVA